MSFIRFAIFRPGNFFLWCFTFETSNSVQCSECRMPKLSHASLTKLTRIAQSALCVFALREIFPPNSMGILLPFSIPFRITGQSHCLPLSARKQFSSYCIRYTAERTRATAYITKLLQSNIYTYDMCRQSEAATQRVSTRNLDVSAMQQKNKTTKQ